MNNPQFEQNFESMYPWRYSIVKDTIDELSGLSEEEVISRLVSTVNWAKYGMANEVSLSRQLDRYLQSLVYAETPNGIIPRPENQDILDRLVGNIPIYWRSVKPAADSTHFIHNTFLKLNRMITIITQVVLIKYMVRQILLYLKVLLVLSQVIQYIIRLEEAN